ncbi:DUF4097 family beta strand repeat-containing protein [Cecembia lonarensis]|uniref:Uncharacterized protein n=1 Tax=Cecembia lonarensis (strain CCUG 58316 / KCTC 22772 / LW9) TaxID=1225176 RepID=K1LCW3_CECL9|nr:DUF4097 family beta strand repeat-containing protein [Cecembia lonarensis]EKB50042.1 hypothetical protein B879_01324 [Cecembia lonarensis LW9]
MLNRLSLLLCLFFGWQANTWAQLTKEFKVEEKYGFSLVQVDFNIYKGTSKIVRHIDDSPIKINCELSKVNILPDFSHNIKDQVLYSELIHRNVESENLGKSLSYKLFSSQNDDFDHKWTVNLNSNYLYALNFQFGIGKAHFDLSQLPISNCHIKSASADITLDYSKKKANSVKMDTMHISINMGTLQANHLNLTNAKYMLFEANYGSLNLNFSESMPESSQIYATVGAGKVDLQLPNENQPAIVKIKSTAMCRTSIPKHWKDIGNKTYVNKSYDEKAENLLSLMIDVSVGSVTIR